MDPRLWLLREGRRELVPGERKTVEDQKLLVGGKLAMASDMERTGENRRALGEE